MVSFREQGMASRSHAGGHVEEVPASKHVEVTAHPKRPEARFGRLCLIAAGVLRR